MLSFYMVMYTVLHTELGKTAETRAKNVEG